MKAFLFLFCMFLGSICYADVIDDVAVVFKNGSAKELAQNFSSNVELSVLNKEGIYSKAQAEMIMKDFFVKNQPLSSKIIHKVVSNINYKFGVIILKTVRNSFRVSYELKNTEGKFLISQIRIEDNKE